MIESLWGKLLARLAVQIRDEVVMWWNLSVGPFGLGQVTSTISLSEESDRGDTKRSSFDRGRARRKRRLLTTQNQSACPDIINGRHHSIKWSCLVEPT